MPAKPQTFYWHDYETWGADPRRDRPAQFAGQRTGLDLTPIGPPLVLLCRPAADLLPHPEACLITRLTPQRAEAEGVREAELAAAIHRELATPGTCAAGYNSIRFDDEVTRHLLYRNFYDPYAREWQNGNSRWDLIDTLRLAHALRPEDIVWPVRDDGATSFRLEDLAAANDLNHGQAHDALSDVNATIDLARLLRARKPRLFDYALTLRDKRKVDGLLTAGRPLLHVSARYPAAAGCIAPVLTLARHPGNAGGYIVYDLRHDPDPLIDLPVEALRALLFTRAADRPADAARLALKTVRVGRAPILAPLATLTPEAAERWSIDPARIAAHAERLAAHSEDIAAKLAVIYQSPPAGTGGAPSDPDLMLYSGGFFKDEDRRRMERLRALDPQALAQSRLAFDDPRVPAMLLRYRARNWPETLTPEEQARWEAHRRRWLTDPAAGAGITLEEFARRLLALREASSDPILDALEAWGRRLSGRDLTTFCADPLPPWVEP